MDVFFPNIIRGVMTWGRQSPKHCGKKSFCLHLNSSSYLIWSQCWNLNDKNGSSVCQKGSAVLHLSKFWYVIRCSKTASDMLQITTCQIYMKLRDKAASWTPRSDIQRECHWPCSCSHARCSRFHCTEQSAVKSTNRWMNGLKGTGGRVFLSYVKAP